MTDPTTVENGRGPLASPKLWVALVLLVGVVVFIVQNREPTEIRLLLVSVTSPLWVTLTAAVVVGGLIGWLLRPSGSTRTGRAARRGR
ncbi:LapA family protein [Nocardiopsis changdeensis]|uniref:LapA family protein n=1 Tax=Nocardiopsis changdeensis TaxID=2831969 RepID=A0ABX8BGQ5_9ACTN|nr:MULTISPECIES: LapA family protein [Nocardiopsis]QUX20121.1 LapA family protein [Nocardiopsis changdeensis]QYX36049.1 LapA family protein [Nocardiopsis sp. MT53]